MSVSFSLILPYLIFLAFVSTAKIIVTSSHLGIHDFVLFENFKVIILPAPKAPNTIDLLGCLLLEIS